MGPSHHFDAVRPEYIGQRLYFRAEFLRPAVIAAADAKMDSVRMNFENPPYLLHQALIILQEMAAAAALHKGLQLHLFPMIPFESPLPPVQI